MFKLYIRFISKYFKSMMAYKLDFTVGFFSIILVHLVNIVFIGLVFARIDEIAGWDFNQMLYLYALVGLSITFNQLFFDGINNIPSFILHGGLDRLLLRPLNPLVHIFFLKLDQNATGGFLFSIGLLIYSLIKLNVIYDCLGMLFTFLTILCSIAIVLSINLIINSLSFWFLRVDVLCRLFESLYEYARFPISIYNQFVKTVFVFVIPLGGVIFYPARYILFGERGAFNILFPVIITAFFVFLATAVWKRGLANYTSCGN